MSGLAEILLNNGFTVSGSDLKLNAACKRLQKLGARICEGHRAENLADGASLLVYSSAVSPSNPEMQEAEKRGIPVIRRAEVLAELMRLKFGVAVAGSHGKTTTTSMTAAVMEGGGLDPTVIIGGQVKSIESGGKAGKGDFLVAESDESDRSFLLLKPTIAVVTNIDAEHLSAYSSLADLEESFAKFVSSVPFYGLSVFCIDDQKVRDLYTGYKGRKLSYGFSVDANLRAADLVYDKTNTSCDVLLNGEKLFRVTLPMPGRHMVLNSLAAVAIGLEFKIAPETIERSLAGFSGVKRRLEVIGEAGGVTVINDYGHHPSEIRATLNAVRNGWSGGLKTLHVVFQPHRYSRTKDCFVEFLDAFKEADNLILTDIYSAGEQEIKGISGEVLFDAIIHSRKHFVKELNSVPDGLVKDLEPGDVVVCLGAGSIGAFPETLLQRLS